MDAPKEYSFIAELKTIETNPIVFFILSSLT